MHLNRQLVRPNVVQSASPDTIRTAHGEFNLYPKLIVFPAKDLPGQIPEVSYSTIRELHVEENRLRKPGSVQIHGLRIWTSRNVVRALFGQSRSHALDRNAQSISRAIFWIYRHDPASVRLLIRHIEGVGPRQRRT